MAPHRKEGKSDRADWEGGNASVSSPFMPRTAGGSPQAESCCEAMEAVTGFEPV